MKISTKLLAILLCACFSLLIFANNIFANENSLVTVNADTIEQQDSQKIKNDEIKEINDENLYSLPQSSDKISIFSSKSEILSSITSNDEFSIKGNILINGQTADVNDFYDFSNYSKYNIADWLYSINVITEKEKIDCYCDLILNKNFYKVECLNGCYNQIQTYLSNNIVDSSLTKKIDDVLNYNYFTNKFSQKLGTRAGTETSYENDYFTIYYDSSIDTYAEAEEVGNYLNYVRSRFINMGFNVPILEEGKTKLRVYLEPYSNGLVLGRTVCRQYPNSNVSESWFYFYNFTRLNDDLRQIIAHEYFHGIQNAYNYDYRINETAWFSEATANLSVYMITGSINVSQGHIIEFITSEVSSRPLSNVNGYGAVVFPLILYNYYGGYTVIKKIYEEYHTYGINLTMFDLREIISAGMAECGCSGGFDEAYRLMAGHLYAPSLGFADLGYDDWGTPNIEEKPITSVNGSISFSVSLNYLTSKYYRIEIPESSVCTATVNVSFSNSKGRVQEYRKYTNDCEVLCHTSSSGGVSYASPNLGDNGREAGIILSNVGNSGTVTCNVTVQLTYQIENINFACQHADRYLERRVHLKDDQYAEYNITFGTAGNKIIQTFGTADTTIKVYNSNGILLANSDDDGYEYNAFVSINTSANQTLKIRVALCNEDDEDWTKLSIVPSNLFLEHGSTTFDNYEDILNINTYHNFTLYSYAIINSMQSLTYSPPVDGRYSVTLESEFDNFLYVIDPSSSNLLVEGEDYHDDLDSDYGDYNAHICKNFYSDIRYFVLFGQSNISTPFDNLGTGNDIAVLFRFQNAI